MSAEDAMVAAVSQLFVAFGAHRDTARAQLYVEELERAVRCGACVEIAVQNVMRSARRLPTIAEVCIEGRDVLASEEHGRHITAPQLAPKSETWWRTDAAKIIERIAKCEPDTARFIAAQMWWCRIPADKHNVAEEAADPVWVEGVVKFVEKFPNATPLPIEAAFARARYNAEHGARDMPDSVLNLGLKATA